MKDLSLPTRGLAFLVSFMVLGLGPACLGRTLDVGTALPNESGGQSGGTPAVDGSAPSTTAPGSEGVVAVLEDSGWILDMAADETALYFATKDGAVYAVPRAGGSRRVYVDASSGGATEKVSVTVDESYVYFSNMWATQLCRVAKAGGPVEIVTDQLQDPGQMVMDATHLYALVSDIPSPPGPAVVRVPKAGGPVELVAPAAHGTALVLSENDVYFATGYSEPNGSIQRVAKTGGAVQVLASDIDTRSFLNGGVPNVERLALVGDSVAFVEPFTRLLTLVPTKGGTTRTGDKSIVDLDTAVDDATSLFAVSAASGSQTASLVRLDAKGARGATLATWTYDTPSFTPGAAMAVEQDRVYWVDNVQTGNSVRSTIRVAALR
jgi:hypothetical protein